MATAPVQFFPEPIPNSSYVWVKGALALIPLKSRKDRETVDLVAAALKTLPYECEDIFLEWAGSVGFTRYKAERLWANTKPNKNAWDDFYELCEDAENRRTRFQFFSAEQVEAAPSPEYRIKGIFPTKGIAAIGGPPASAKTFIATAAALAIAAGSSFFGYPTKPGDVVYLVLEGEAGFPTRLKAWRFHHCVPVPDHIRFSCQAFDLTSEHDIDELASHCSPGTTVFIDTLNRAAPGLDENNSKDMGRIIAGADRLYRKIDGLVVLVAHTGKDEAKGLRGHSSLFAALDAAIMVRRGEGGAREWKVHKAKDGKDGESHGFRLEIVELGTDADGDPVTSCVVMPDGGATRGFSKPLTNNQKLGLGTFENAARAHGVLNERGEFAGVPLRAWRQEFYRKCPAENDEAKRKAFNRARTDLTELGHVSVENDVYLFAGLNASAIHAVIATALLGQRDTAETSAGQFPLRSTLIAGQQDPPLSL